MFPPGRQRNDGRMSTCRGDGIRTAVCGRSRCGSGKRSRRADDLACREPQRVIHPFQRRRHPGMQPARILPPKAKVRSWCDLTRSPSRRRMAGICAKRTASVDVKRLSQIPAVDVAVAGKLSFASNYRPHPPLAVLADRLRMAMRMSSLRRPPSDSTADHAAGWEGEQSTSSKADIDPRYHRHTRPFG
jgi:hypothetical protein